jgi:hypothetical protein
VNGIDESRVSHVDIPIDRDLEVDVANAMRMASGRSPDQFIDSNTRNYSNFLLVLLKTDGFAAESLGQVLRALSDFAIKYKQEYKKMPVLIIDNASRLARKHQGLLDLFWDYAKDAADNGTASVVFVSSKGRLPRRMMHKSMAFIVSFVRWLLSTNTVLRGEAHGQEVRVSLKLASRQHEFMSLLVAA